MVVNGATKHGDMAHFDAHLSAFRAAGGDVSYEYLHTQNLVALQVLRGHPPPCVCRVVQHPPLTPVFATFQGPAAPAILAKVCLTAMPARTTRLRANAHLHPVARSSWTATRPGSALRACPSCRGAPCVCWASIASSPAAATRVSAWAVSRAPSCGDGGYSGCRRGRVPSAQKAGAIQS